MPATPADIIAFFALSGNRPTITGPQLTRVQAWLDTVLGLTSSTPDNLTDFIYDLLRDRVLDSELSRAQDLVARPTF